MITHIDTIHEHDRQTDRQTPHDSIESRGNRRKGVWNTLFSQINKTPGQ